MYKMQFRYRETYIADRTWHNYTYDNSEFDIVKFSNSFIYLSNHGNVSNSRILETATDKIIFETVNGLLDETFNLEDHLPKPIPYILNEKPVIEI